MGARIVGLIVAVLIVVAVYFGYQHYKQEKNLDSGAVHCIGCLSPEAEARFKKENAGEAETPAARQTQGTPQQAANDSGSTMQTAPAPVTDTQSADASAQDNVQAPPVPQQAAPGPAVQASYSPAASPAQPTMAGSPDTAPPTSDSQGMNAPNGMRFAGSGSYQWYRQGNLTWRIDTTSGRSCIVYATMEEWRKQIVISHGCGRSA